MYIIYTTIMHTSDCLLLQRDTCTYNLAHVTTFDESKNKKMTTCPFPYIGEPHPNLTKLHQHPTAPTVPSSIGHFCSDQRI